MDTGDIIIWRGLVWARRQILQKQSWLLPAGDVCPGMYRESSGPILKKFFRHFTVMV